MKKITGFIYFLTLCIGAICIGGMGGFIESMMKLYGYPGWVGPTIKHIMLLMLLVSSFHAASGWLEGKKAKHDKAD